MYANGPPESPPSDPDSLLMDGALGVITALGARGAWSAGFDEPTAPCDRAEELVAEKSIGANDTPNPDGGRPGRGFADGFRYDAGVQ